MVSTGIYTRVRTLQINEPANTKESKDAPRLYLYYIPKSVESQGKSLPN